MLGALDLEQALPGHDYHEPRHDYYVIVNWTWNKRCTGTTTMNSDTTIMSLCIGPGTSAALERLS